MKCAAGSRPAMFHKLPQVSPKMKLRPAQRTPQRVSVAFRTRGNSEI